MFSARGSVGASTKAQLGPVLSCGGCWPCRKNGWQQASLPAHAHPTRWEDKEGVEARLGMEGKAARGLLDPLTQRERGCYSWSMGSESL